MTFRDLFRRSASCLLVGSALLLGGVAFAEDAKDAVQPATGAAHRDTHQTSAAPLITRQQVKLNLAGAEHIIRGAMARARSLKVAVNIAVVDEGGHLLAFARMDGARPGSSYTAITKATTAATMRRPTGPVGGNPPDTRLNLALEQAAAASGGKITTLYGGVPILVDGQVIGAVGVGRATGEQDAEAARAGISTLVTALDSQPRSSEH